MEDRIISEAFGREAMQLATEQKRQLLSRLLARLAHEVRNPLSSLDIHVQLLQEDLAPLAETERAQATARLQTIREELHRLERIVEDFLRLAGPSSLELRPVSLEEVIRHVGEVLRPEAAARQIAIRTALEPALPPLLADAAQLTQALINLVLNGLQAIEREGAIDIAARAQPPASLLIEVTDSGPGVPAEHQATIFEPYFTTRRDGTGLGLWIAQQIAVAHGGTIQVANAPAGGAVFTLRLPWLKPL